MFKKQKCVQSELCQLESSLFQLQQIAFSVNAANDSSPCDHLKHRFLDLTKVEFWPFQEAVNDFYVPFDHLNRRFIDLKNVIFSVVQGAENDFKVTFDNLNHRLFDFIQIAFWASPEAQNKFRVPCEPLKHRFFEFTEVAFWAGQGEEYKLQSNFGLVKRQKMTFKCHLPLESSL